MGPERAESCCRCIRTSRPDGRSTWQGRFRAVEVRPWPAVASAAFCRRMDGANQRETDGHRAAIDTIIQDLAAFKTENRLDSIVMINLASTERTPADALALRSLDAFERALDDDDAVNRPGNVICSSGDRSGRSLRQFYAFGRRRRTGIDRDGATPRRADCRQGRQDRADHDENGACAVLSGACLARGWLVLDQHPGQS